MNVLNKYCLMNGKTGQDHLTVEYLYVEIGIQDTQVTFSNDSIRKTNLINILISLT